MGFLDSPNTSIKHAHALLSLFRTTCAANHVCMALIGYNFIQCNIVYTTNMPQNDIYIKIKHVSRVVLIRSLRVRVRALTRENVIQLFIWCRDKDQFLLVLYIVVECYSITYSQLISNWCHEYLAI